MYRYNLQNLVLNDVVGSSPDKVVRFEVWGEPKSKQRPRVTQRGTFTPKETIEAEKRIRDCWRGLGEQPFPYQLLVEIDFYNGNKQIGRAHV